MIGLGQGGKLDQAENWSINYCSVLITGIERLTCGLARFLLKSVHWIGIGYTIMAPLFAAAASHKSCLWVPKLRWDQHRGALQRLHSVSFVQVDASSNLKGSSAFLGLPLLCSRARPMKKMRGGALSSQCSSSETLRWVSTISAMVLLLVKNTGIRKPLLVPLLALQMPQDVVTWMRTDYGMWTAFLTLCVRLFYLIPGELELPLVLLLLVITAPYQVMQQRSTQAGLIIWATLASYLGFQHLSKAGGVARAFRQNVILPTLASVCLVAAPIVILYQGY